jgi:hypothetical protein
MAIDPPLVEMPIWALCLDMAHGDPLRAKQIFLEVDSEWVDRWMVWRKERARVGIPDYMIGMYAEKK